jgi:parvulin-like peptidyl-prolyl isomerase
MAKKSKKTAVLTRKQIALSKRDRQLQRRVYIGLGALIALVLVILGAGAYREFVLKPATPVATVNGEPIRLDTYEKRVRYRRWDLDHSIAQVRAQMAQLNPDAAESEFLVSYYQQALSQLNSQRAQVNFAVVDELIQEVLTRQKAAAESLTVSEDEVSQEINRQMAGGLGAVTAVDATATVVAGPGATATALTFTPTPLPTPTPTLTATLAITTPPAPSADEGTPISPTVTPAPTPTTRISTDQELGQQYQQLLQQLREGPGWGEADYRELVRTSLLVDKLQKLFEDTASTTAEQVHASHILSKEEEGARKALARVQEGEDFATVAAELSEDEETREKGGDLGWFPKDTVRVPTTVAEAAFALQPGQVVTDVVRSYLGYHVVKVLERDPNRPLAAEDLQYHKRRAFSDWLQGQLADPNVVVSMWSPEMAPPEEGQPVSGAQ